jgi:nicotinate-nucleotide adenylyltransferase
MNIGILGGTFDPPHIAHLVLADECTHQLALDRLLWVLTPDPPHKRSLRITPLEHRLEMLQMTIANHPGFELSTVDIDRPPPHYAVDTVHRLAQAYPDACLYYLMGGDSYHDLPTWYRPRELLQAVYKLGVVRRPGDGVDLTAMQALLPGIADKTVLVDAPLLDISASDLRHRIAHGLPFRYFVLPDVYHLIVGRKLYRYDLDIP